MGMMLIVADDHDPYGAQLPGAHAQRLDPSKQAAWDQATAAARELSAALREGRRDDADKALGELQVDRGLEWPEVRDALHVPADAGALGGELEAVLRRIPDGWGRWIGVGRGWYRLVTELNQALSRLDPGYVVNQVKEKFGGLRYYYEPSGGLSERTAAAMQSLVMATEAKASQTCEQCGAPAVLQQSAAGLYQTRCPACAGGDPERAWRPVS